MLMVEGDSSRVLADSQPNESSQIKSSLLFQ